ncbi:MAG: histidine phosphatase family protein [Chloroflexi bacterium]|nr:histidine phosphatase family protein [Chloroflexota bacterium]
MVLVRHGESTWIPEGRFQGQGDPPLSPIGRRQAALAADRLARSTRSPALPVMATLIGASLAGPDGSGTAVPRRADPGFLEIGQGDWEGLPTAEVLARWPEVIAGWRLDPLRWWAPGGESLPEVDARVRAALVRLLDALGGQGAEAARPDPGPRSHVLGYGDPGSSAPWSIVVGHDGASKIALLALLDLPLERFWSFPFALAGISVVEIRAGRPRLRAHNLVDHLAPLESESGIPGPPDRGRTGAL